MFSFLQVIMEKIAYTKMIICDMEIANTNQKQIIYKNKQLKILGVKIIVIEY